MTVLKKYIEKKNMKKLDICCLGPDSKKGTPAQYPRVVFIWAKGINYQVINN